MHLTSIFLALLIPSLTLAEEKPSDFSQDPLCIVEDFFQKDFERASEIHKKYPQLRIAQESRARWYRAVSGEMRSACESDKKFAALLVAKKKAELSGQCKPAEEAALYDTEVLEHSESALSRLKAKKLEFASMGAKGAFEPLPVVAEKNWIAVRDYTITLQEVPFQALCELSATIPENFWRRKADIVGCPPAANPDQPETGREKNPALFGKMLHRFEQSLAYNTERRDRAALAARASIARYQGCIAEHKDLPPNPRLSIKNYGQGSGVQSKGTRTRQSDITGTEEDKKKRSSKN